MEEKTEAITATTNEQNAAQEPPQQSTDTPQAGNPATSAKGAENLQEVFINYLRYERNMSPETMSQAVELRDQEAPKVVLEASGGVNLKTIAEVAAAGVDRISVGALTHSAPVLDLGLDWQEDKGASAG